MRICGTRTACRCQDGHRRSCGGVSMASFRSPRSIRPWTFFGHYCRTGQIGLSVSKPGTVRGIRLAVEDWAAQCVDLRQAYPVRFAHGWGDLVVANRHTQGGENSPPAPCAVPEGQRIACRYRAFSSAGHVKRAPCTRLQPPHALCVTFERDDKALGGTYFTAQLSVGKSRPRTFSVVARHVQ